MVLHSKRSRFQSSIYLLSIVSIIILISFPLVESCSVLQETKSETSEWNPLDDLEDYPILTETQTSITLSPTQYQFLLVLKSNPSTGYTWNDDTDNHNNIHHNQDKILQLVQCKYERSIDASQRVGAGGFEYWLYEINENEMKTHNSLTQPETIHLIYARSWDIKHPVKQITFTINISPRSIE